MPEISFAVSLIIAAAALVVGFALAFFIQNGNGRYLTMTVVFRLVTLFTRCVYPFKGFAYAIVLLESS